MMLKELVDALMGSTSPLVKAFFFVIYALHGSSCGSGTDGCKWTCCTDDGLTVETPSATDGWQMLRNIDSSTLPIVEVHYHAGCGHSNIVKVKLVSMDSCHFVLIAQGRDNKDGVSLRPVSVSFSTSEDPFASVVFEGTEWTAEKVEAVVAQLRPVLNDAINRQQDGHSSGGSGGGCSGQTAAEDAQRRRAAGGQHEFIPDVNVCSGPHNVIQPRFSGEAQRVPGYRYGEADLLPGGAHPSLAAGGGMLLDPGAFDPNRGGSLPRPRYDPMFPGDISQANVGRPGGGRMFPGEPDPDDFKPPGGPAFGTGFGLFGSGGGGGRPPPPPPGQFWR